MGLEAGATNSFTLRKLLKRLLEAPAQSELEDGIAHTDPSHHPDVGAEVQPRAGNGNVLTVNALAEANEVCRVRHTRGEPHGEDDECSEEVRLASPEKHEAEEAADGTKASGDQG
jgi:hypothetical protein